MGDAVHALSGGGDGLVDGVTAGEVAFARNHLRFCSVLYAHRASASASSVRPSRPRVLVRYSGSACSTAWSALKASADAAATGTASQHARLHELQELCAGPLDVGLQRCPDVGGYGGDVVQVGRPGRGDQPGFHDRRLGSAPEAARLEQAGRALKPAILARQGLVHRVGGRRGLALVLRPLPGTRTGRIAAGLIRAGLLTPPRKVLRLDGRLLPQPLLEDLAALQGPSPRVRGAGSGQRTVEPGPGTIPAGAGSRDDWPISAGRAWDHPRGCGEPMGTIAATTVPLGPSPRVRGAGRDQVEVLAVQGTIPAGAGSRQPRSCWSRCCRDHPRGCGEQSRSDLKPGDLLGPSPRVRGAGRRVRAGHAAEGTIPAGAGSSRRRGRRASRRWDHPRGCGEQLNAISPEAAARGPSPRVRGAGRGRTRSSARRGAIPAGAGSRLDDLRLYWPWSRFLSTSSDFRERGTGDLSFTSPFRSVGVLTLCSSRTVVRSGELSRKRVRSGWGGGSG
ncbi:hypothetical protein QFZ76_010295 [Streptomyces sp. V4I2]|nr:hypothetical protein [Streptomyces sp. V4I2]